MYWFSVFFFVSWNRFTSSLLGMITAAGSQAHVHTREREVLVWFSVSRCSAAESLMFCINSPHSQQEGWRHPRESRWHRPDKQPNLITLIFSFSTFSARPTFDHKSAQYWHLLHTLTDLLPLIVWVKVGVLPSNYSVCITLLGCVPDDRMLNQHHCLYLLRWCGGWSP